MGFILCLSPLGLSLIIMHMVSSRSPELTFFRVLMELMDGPQSQEDSHLDFSAGQGSMFFTGS